MPTIHTLGHPYKRSQFTYTGSVTESTILEFTGRPLISSEFFHAILDKFKGETIPGGFSMTNPPLGGLGDWVKHHSQKLNHVSLSPRHASFIAAILAWISTEHKCLNM
jgi:hypothetical protein